jgi:hypothetical protein
VTALANQVLAIMRPNFERQLAVIARDQKPASTFT